MRLPRNPKLNSVTTLTVVRFDRWIGRFGINDAYRQFVPDRDRQVAKPPGTSCGTLTEVVTAWKVFGAGIP
jgi:hypothetical protein